VLRSISREARGRGRRRADRRRDDSEWPFSDRVDVITTAAQAVHDWTGELSADPWTKGDLGDSSWLPHRVLVLGL